MYRQRMTWLVAAACGVLAAVAVVWLARTPDTARAPLTPVPIAAVGVVPLPDGRTVNVHLTYSSCQEFDRVDVAEDARTVRLTAYVHDLPSCGTVPTTSQVVPVWLSSPLWDRTVVDGDTGAPVRTG